MTTAHNTSAVTHILILHHLNDGAFNKTILASSLVFLTGLLSVFSCCPGDMRIQRCTNWTAVILTNFYVTKTVFLSNSFEVFYKFSTEDAVVYIKTCRELYKT
jgi:hypothetical protein